MFYVIARGTALLEVDGEKALSLSACDVVFLPHGTAHVIRDSATTQPMPVCDGKESSSAAPRTVGGNGVQTSLILGFFELAGEPAALLERMPNILTLSPNRMTSDPWVSATVQLMLAESASPGPGSVIILQRLADVLFVQALRSASSRSSCPPSGLAALSDSAVHEALGLLHRQVSRPWTVEELAKRVGLSRSGFAARFRSLVGEPPLQYLARWRIARAAELLSETKTSIGEVATSVGYESVPSFSKAFKRWRGVSPGAFRRIERGANAP
jgi:AraC-like DNA-binding protein